jgi:hypothetical protein
MGSHAFIKHRDKFYDSERLNGVLHYWQLPATKNGKGCGCSVCKKPAKRLFVPMFKRYWNNRLDWNALDKQALEVIKNG